MGGGPRGHVIFEGPQEHLGESGSHISKQGKWSQVGLINIGKYGRPFIWIELMHRPGKNKNGSHIRVLHPQNASRAFQESRIRDKSKAPKQATFKGSYNKVPLAQTPSEAGEPKVTWGSGQSICGACARPRV